MSSTVERIGVRELRQHASRYLEHVEAGATVEVTRHGRPVARIVPIAPRGDRLAELEAEGVLLPEDEPGDLLDVVPARPMPGAPLPSEELIRMRDEERW